MVLARRGHPTEAAHGEIIKTAEVEQMLEWLCTLSVGAAPRGCRG
jgi:hypothetical protein